LRLVTESYASMGLAHKLIAAVFALVLFSPPLAAQPKGAAPATAPHGVRTTLVQGRAQLEVEGAPFFIYGSAFPYYGIPADLWERSLEEYRSLGINTIDLRIPWNWHEVAPGDFDFAGRTNPRRDLRRLLRLIAEKELKLLVRPAATIGHWKNRGEPDEVAGASPPQREAALRKFVAAVAQELKPYLPTAAVSIVDREAKKEGTEKTVSGPLLMVGLPLASLSAELQAAGIDIPVFLPAAEKPESGIATAELPTIVPSTNRRETGLPPRMRLRGSDASAIELIVDGLATRTGQLEIISNVPWGVPPPADDVRAVESSFDEPLLRSRLAMGQGVAGMIYEGVQDWLLPASFAPPGSNLFHRIDAALDVNASHYPGARSVERTGNLLEVWGTFLAASHKRADFAVVLSAASREASAQWQQLSQSARAISFSLAAVDPQSQLVDALLEHPVLLWNTLLTGPLPATAQTRLLDYAMRGGTLVVFPQRPQPGPFSAVWNSAETQPGQYTVGDGIVLFAGDNPFGADQWEESVGAPNNPAGAAALQQWLQSAGRRPILTRKNSPDDSLVIWQLVNNSGARPVGDRLREGASGLLSITNLNSVNADDELEILSPRVGTRSRDETLLHLPITVPPHESLLLPLHARLCSDAGKSACDDEIIVAGAEFLRAEREGKALELTFYAPVRAVARLRLEGQPSRVRADEMNVEGTWTPVTREFEIAIPRGPAPDYLRVVKIQLPYEPHVREKPDPEKIHRRDWTISVADGMRFPLAPDAALETFPPLITLKGDHSGRMVLQGHNYDLMGRRIDFRLSGSIKGSEELGLDGGELGFRRMDLKPGDNGNSASGSGLLEGQLDGRSGRDHRNLPVAFVAVEESGVAAYPFDFERDGAKEWVLEDQHLRIVAAPERGGSLVALIDKDSGTSLTTTLAFLRDSITDNTAEAPPPRDLGREAYTAAWIGDGENKALRLDSPELQGLQIQKSIHITEKQAFEVRYHWEGPALFARTLATALSVPVTLHGDNTTRFCWEKPMPESAPNMHCEVFEPAGKPVVVPEGIHHLEVRTPGSFMLRVEWPAGEMRVEMKNYSAWLRFEFPRPAGQATAGEGLLKFQAAVVE